MHGPENVKFMNPPPAFPYDFILLCVIKHRYNFTVKKNGAGMQWIPSTALGKLEMSLLI